MRTSITTRLALYFGLSATAVLLAIGYSVGRSVEGHFEEMDAMELHGKLELVRHVLAKVRTAPDVALLRERMDDALTGHEGLAVAIVRPDGGEVYATKGAQFPERLLRSPLAETSGAHAALATWDDSGHSFRGFAARAPTEYPALPYAVVALAIRIDQHRDFLELFYRSLWLVIAGGIASTGLLGWLAAAHGLAPVREMTGVARSITASRLDERLPLEALPVELRELASAFNDMLQRLEDSFRRLTEFSSDLAHELRTPIANMKTQTEVALARARTADEYREVLYSNVEEYDRVARMISDMLFLAKADRGLIVPRSEPIDLAAEVRELFDFYEALAEHTGVRLALAGEGAAIGERLMIRRAIGNLLSNALNHTPRGGTVTVRIGQGGPAETRISVENPGKGIAPEHLERIFDRFYRVDPSRQRSTEGAGLGLAITKSIVAAHRGTVCARSENGLTRFDVLLPALRRS